MQVPGKNFYKHFVHHVVWMWKRRGCVACVWCACPHPPSAFGPRPSSSLLPRVEETDVLLTVIPCPPPRFRRVLLSLIINFYVRKAIIKMMTILFFFQKYMTFTKTTMWVFINLRCTWYFPRRAAWSEEQRRVLRTINWERKTRQPRTWDCSRNCFLKCAFSLQVQKCKIETSAWVKGSFFPASR